MATGIASHIPGGEPTTSRRGRASTFAGGARLGVRRPAPQPARRGTRRLDAAFLAQHASSADVARLAKAVAALPHSQARTVGPRTGVSTFSAHSPGVSVPSGGHSP